MCVYIYVCVCVCIYTHIQRERECMYLRGGGGGVYIYHSTHKMRDAKMVTLYKNKGDKGGCNNYRGISLLSVVDKIFLGSWRNACKGWPTASCQRHSLDLRLVDQWLIWSLHCTSCRKIAGNKENHCSAPSLIWQRPLILWAWDHSITYWKKQLSTYPFPINHLFSRGHECVHSIQWKYISLSKWGVVLNWVVSWHPLALPFTLLPSFNMPLMGTRMEFTSEPASMDLFSIWKDWSRNDWRLKCRLENCSADDATIAIHSGIELRRLADHLAEACNLFGLTISVKKTEVIGQGTNSPPEIKLGGESLKTVDKFVYLGSTITSTLSLDEELTSRIGKATATLKKKLVKRAWGKW